MGRAYPWIVRTRLIVAVAVVGTLSSCGLIPQPDYGEPHKACRLPFSADTELAWAGHGHPTDVGLARPGFDPSAVGEIYVQKQPPANDHVDLPYRYCVVVSLGGDRGYSVFDEPVPEGWQPP